MNVPSAKVIGIVGSPRHGMNMATLVQKVLDGAKSRGMDTQLLYLQDYTIDACDACDACKQVGRCIKDDGMRFFYSAIEHASVLVLGTPIYFDHVSAQTKLFLDRLYPYSGPNMEHYFPKDMKAVLVFTWGDTAPKLYDSVMIWLQDRLSFYFGVETVASIKASDTNRPINQRSDQLQQAFIAGASLPDRLMEDKHILAR